MDLERHVKYLEQMVHTLSNETDSLKIQIVELKRRFEELEETVARLDSAHKLYGPIKYGEYRSWLNNLN